MGTEKKQVILLNGSIRGNQGNSGSIAEKIASHLHSRKIASEILTLADPLPDIGQVSNLLREAHGFFAISGSYWSSWGSPMQRFLEVMTAFENTPVFFGKPFACAISMDSVGGLDIAQRLHGAFAGLGCWSPPCSTMVLSRVGQEAINASAGSTEDPNEDVWRLSDLEPVLHNLVLATQVNVGWQSWPYKKLELPSGPWPVGGTLVFDKERFL